MICSSTMLTQNISPIPFDAEKSDRSTYVELLEKSSTRSRMIVVCAPTAVLSDILLTPDNLGMLSDGEYVFFNVDRFSTNSKLIRPWISEAASI
jgi:hypothetical protein